MGVAKRTIVIIQTLEQLNYYLKNDFKNDNIIFPVGPDVVSSLEIKKISYISLSQLLKSIDTKYEEEKSLRYIDKAIEKLNKLSLGITNSKIEIGNYYSFQLWIILGQIHYNILICDSLRNLSPTKIVVYSNYNTDELYLKYRPNPNNLLSTVVRNYFGKELVDQIFIHEKKDKVLNFKHFILIFFSDRFVEFVKFLVKKSRERIFKRDGLILVGGEHDWKKLLKSDSFKINRLTIFNLFVTKSAFVDKAIPILHESIKSNGNIAYNLEYLAKFICSDISFFHKIHDNKLRIIKKNKAVISSVFTFPEENFLAHLGKKSGIPVIVWQHGEKGSFHDVTIPYTELQYATDYIAYGPSVIEYFKRAYGLRFPNVNFHYCGNLSKISVQSSHNIILYATGKWLKTGAPISLNHNGEDLRLLEAHKKILTYLNSIDTHCEVVFKANNTLGSNLIPDSYNHYKNVKIEYNTPFSDLLSRAQILILDTPGTTLVEATSLRIPIFVLGNAFNFESSFLDKVKKRVVWCSNSDELVYELRRYFEKNFYGADLHNDEYFDAYCGFRDKNLIVKTLVQQINKIIYNEKRN